MEALTQVIHPRLGFESPANSLSALPLALITEILLEEEHLLEEMLQDYYHRHPELHPDVEERVEALVAMHTIYLNHPSKSNLARLDAFASGLQEEFMTQQAEVITCVACGASRYYLGHLPKSPNCSFCHLWTILIDISVCEIPPNIDVDTYCWISEGEDDEDERG